MIHAMKLHRTLIPWLLLVAGCTTPDAPEAGNPVAGAGGAAAIVEHVAGEETKERKPEPEVAAAPVGSIGLTELFGLVESGEVLLYDVRPPFYQRLGRISGSISLPRKKFAELVGGEQERMRQANKAGRSIVLYCANLKCPDADAVAAELSRRGIASRVYHAGWEEWKAAELPTE